MEYIEIKEQIKQKLPVARDLGDSENLLELGLSSLTIMRLVNQWRKQGDRKSGRVGKECRSRWSPYH